MPHNVVDPAETDHITRDIIGGAIHVHQVFGPGLLESLYQACMVVELRQRGRSVETRVPVPLVYKSVTVDVAYYLDMVVDDRVIVELKAVERLAPIHTAQLLTYLRLTRRSIGLLINFNVPVLKDGVKRIINTRI